MSYASFTWDDATVRQTGTSDDVVVALDVPVTNRSATRSGTEVVQVYVHDVDTSVPRPPQELKGFAKLALSAGETATARITLDRRAFAFWDPDVGEWTVEPGDFELRIGTSSRDIKQRLTVSMD